MYTIHYMQPVAVLRQGCNGHCPPPPPSLMICPHSCIAPIFVCPSTIA